MNEKRLRTNIRVIVRAVLMNFTGGRASKALISDVTDRLMAAVRKELNA